jgi:glyoxalase family protein
MDLELGGLHHVTAVTADAPGNVAFYTQTLGLRLVKQTVNQDDVSAYHLFYGDEVGSPGTEVTFFDWAYTPPRQPGHGEVAAIALRVPGRAALDWWLARLDAHGVTHGPLTEHAGRAAVGLSDPEGQRLLLVDDSGAALPGGTPWAASPVPVEAAIRGMAAVTLTVARLDYTALVLTEALGFRQTGEWAAPDGSGRRLVSFETGPGGPGATVHVDVQPDAPRARQGYGGVHHIAFRTPDDAQHRAWQQHLSRLGLQVTPVIDRYYFRSIYFREPGGVLYEIATDGPGFAVDEDAATLGERLALPPFLEPRRAAIEAGLRPLTVTPAGARRS